MIELNVGQIADWAEDKGDGSRWHLSSDTIQPDITPFELAQILNLRLDMPDGTMRNVFTRNPALKRHFRQS